MAAPNSPSLLARLRGTPGSIRRKFRKAQSLNVVTSTTPPGTPTMRAKSQESSTATRQDDGESRKFSCRFLGLMTIYTLNPEHCYGFAEGLAKAAGEGENRELNGTNATKCHVVMKERSIEIQRIEKRHLHKRKPHSVGTPPPSSRVKSNVLGGSTISLHHHGKSTSPLIRQRTVSCDEIISGDPNRDSIFRNSGNINGSPQISVLTAAPYPERAGRVPPPTTIFDFPDQRYVRDTTLSTMPECQQENINATIPLHEIAYCVTVPTNQRVFLLTSRQGVCLVCRVFLFSRREKAQALTVALANQFKKSYMEWQAQKQVKRKLSAARERAVYGVRDANDNYKSTFPRSKVTERNRSAESFESGDCDVIRSREDSSKDSGNEDDVYSSQDDLDSDEKTNEELAMCREFERRASCMDRPERILFDDDVTPESLEKYCDNIFAQSDGFTSDDERESDESDERLTKIKFSE